MDTFLNTKRILNENMLHMMANGRFWRQILGKINGHMLLLFVSLFFLTILQTYAIKSIMASKLILFTEITSEINYWLIANEISWKSTAKISLKEEKKKIYSMSVHEIKHASNASVVT